MCVEARYSNNGFATFSKTVIIIYNMSNIEHSLKHYIRRTFQQQSSSLI